MSVELKINSLYGMGMECMERGEYADAIKHFENSMELRRRSITAARMYECYIKLNRPKEARDSIQMAFMLNQKSDTVATQYAAILLQEKNYKKATALLSNVLQRNPSYTPAQKLYDQLPIRNDG